jgi:enolase
MRSAIESIMGPIRSAVVGLPSADQRLLDRTLVDADGTPDKRKLGSNALLAVSLATAQAASASSGDPLWRHVAGLAEYDADRCELPRPMVSILSGGQHARGAHPIQDFLVIPLAAETLSEALTVATRVRDEAMTLVERATSLPARLAPSGALYNSLPSADGSLELLDEAARAAHFVPGVEVGFAIDLAAADLAVNGGYIIDPSGIQLSPAELLAMFDRWQRVFGVVSLEDPFGDDEWADWVVLTDRLGNRSQILGDDLFTTALSRFDYGVSIGAANAVLLKPNQCGTLTELLDVALSAKRAGYSSIVSQRSVETEDTAIADIAVGCGADQAKFGPLVHSERLAKYNRLLELEAVEGMRLAPWRASRIVAVD